MRPAPVAQPRRLIHQQPRRVHVHRAVGQHVADGVELTDHAVELPPSDSLRDDVSYAIGVLTNARHRENAERYLSFVGSEAGQAAYAKFGFVNATADELREKRID